MSQKDFEDRFQARLREYGEFFNLDELNDANDRTLLHIMIRTELMIETFQADIQALMGKGAADNATSIKKLADLLRDATATITQLQRTLGIDRKSRRSEDVESVADYIKTLKQDAKSFMDKRLTKIYCPTCKVLVARLAPAHEHTAFTASFACSQCGKSVKVQRKGKDVFFDVKDADWRRKYRAEIVLPTQEAEAVSELDQFTGTGERNPIDVTIYADPAAFSAPVSVTTDPTVQPPLIQDLEIQR